MTIGHLPLRLDLHLVAAWQSEAFEIVGDVESYSLRCDSDGDGWEFSDALLKAQLPAHTDADFLVAIVGVPIEDNWYSRRLGDNQVVFTYHQVRDYLAWENIPQENAILRILYAYTLVFRRAGNRIPGLKELPSFTHDETRRCLFDMNGVKSDLVESCNKPIVCGECEERLRNDRVSDQMIRVVQREIRRIEKHLYHRAFDFVKARPIAALVLSSAFAVLLGALGSLLASYIYDGLK